MTASPAYAPPCQQEQQTEALKGTGCIIVDDVVDARVSGKINLDDRPKLGRWMKDPLWHECAEPCTSEEGPSLLPPLEPCAQ
ncbi:hypothetical protein ACFV4T_33195 [Streptomyces sp. NPDC059755]|uniref:hypothetical protein n=1 Tax=Streptomyces sp. NPDC059755 TaxID=3346934 RepID=UPI003656ADAA